MEPAEAGGGISAARSSPAAVQATNDDAAASKLTNEHVGGGTAQPPSAQTVQELVDSFSGQLPGRIHDKEKSPAGVPVEETDLASYRRDWEKSWGDKCGSFEFYSCVRAMLFTCKRTPPQAGVKTCLQIFSIRVVEINGAYLEWPLEVYGLVATRDSMDHNRNIIFRLRRDACQLLTQQDPFLALTGPAHAIIFTGPVDIEIQLKVKGRTTEHEDKDFISKVLVYERDPSDKLADAGIGNQDIMRTSCFGELCSLQITSALIAEAVEATVISAEVIEGLWPPKSGIRVVSGTASIDEDFVLLDARDGTLRVDPADGVIPITRNVVCVEKDGRLKLSIEAYRKMGRMYAISVTELIPKRSSASIAICKLPFCMVEFTVAWSCLVAKVDDLRKYGI
ncbi:hypothetical protein CFC21_054606 [Triticum aestivum]|uniref:DUF6598 domain-containing protein n=2 Tax=Triticum aestivum TaxID=4565 RepID=A0A3B6I000_WHEAT|nr:uncharacterized protein LOC123082954 isoform X1 [Triticum aestivum]KAF7045503.1 hypothetical protein CFC21_054606 [Triticum aestivum]